MWTLISVGLSLVLIFYNPEIEIPKNKKSIKSNNLQNKIIKGFPYQYFKGEVLTDEVVEFRIRVIYRFVMIFITVTFSGGPIVGQATFTSRLTSIERLIPNQLDSQTNQQEFILNLKGGDDSEVKVVSDKKDDNSNIETKTKTRLGKNSIYVQAFQAIQTFPARPKFNYFDQVEKRILIPSVMVKAHLTCGKQVENLPRQIVKRDKSVKFDKNYNTLFKKHYQDVFDYNLYLEENISKNSANNIIEKAKQNLFKKYGETSKEYLRIHLFENPCIIKSEKCKYLDSDNFVTIYYDQLTDLFAIVDSKTNCLLDFGIATEVKYAEIFAYKSSGTLKAREICLLPNQLVESKELEVYKKNDILSYDDAIVTLDELANSLSPEYREFQSKYYSESLPKRFDTNEYSARKFKELAKDPKNPRQDAYNRVSIDEARAIVQAELKNLVIKPTRQDKQTARRVDLDYKVQGPGSFTHFDVKTPVGSEILKKQNQTISIEDMAYEIGKNIVLQKHRFVGRENGPVSSENVGHLVDLCYVPSNEKAIVRQAILQGARDTGSDAGIIFINDI